MSARAEILSYDRQGQPERLDLLRRLLGVCELPERLAIIGQWIKAIPPIDGYLFSFLDESGAALTCEQLSLPPGFEMVEPTYWKLRFPLADGDEAVQCFTSSAVMRVDADHLADVHGGTRARLERWRLRSMVFIPVRCGAETIGTLLVFSQREALSDRVVAAVEQLLALVADAIAGARRFSQLSGGRAKFLRNAEEREQLIDFFSEAGGLAIDDHFYERLMERFLRYFGFDFVILFLVDGGIIAPERGHTLIEELRAPVEDFTRTCPPYEMNLSTSALPFAVLKRMTLHFPDVQTVMGLPMYEVDRNWLIHLAASGYPLRTLLHVPLDVGTHAIGSLGCYSVFNVMALDAERLRLIELVVRLFARAIKSRTLYQEVETLGQKLLQQAMHDPLTGLYNFGHLQEELERRIEERRRSAPGQGLPLSVIIMDIDHFKRFNDTYGHLAGNAALVQVSDCVVKLVRRMDIVCRYGGEEFFVILPNCALAGAAHLAERIRAAIAAQPVCFDGTRAAVTLSLGVAEYDGGESAASLIGRADRALYRAKSGGRNRVGVWDE